MISDKVTKVRNEIAKYGYEMHLASYGYRVYPAGKPNMGLPFGTLKDVLEWVTIENKVTLR